MKKSSLRTLAPGRSATERAGRRSHTSRHSGIGAFRSSALLEVRLSLLRVAPQQSSTAPSCAARFGKERQLLQRMEQYTPAVRVLQEQYEYVPNLKYEDEHNTQPCVLEPLACAWCKWRSSRTEPQLNQRANQSIKRTGLRPAAYVQR